MPEWKLDPVSVRKTASTVHGCREDGSLENDTVISFIVGLTDSNGKPDVSKLARINVYTHTGTIGTCRVLQGQVRESFKRNVSSLSALRRILSHPPSLTTVGETALEDGAQESLPNKLELAEVGMCIMLSEKEKLQLHLASAVEAAREKEQDVSGMDFEFGLPKKVMKQVEQCLTDILNMGKFVTCVATNGKGAVFLYGHGGVAYTPNIPKQLHQKLKQLKHGRASSSTNAADTRPSYVAIGTRERYYVAFHDGTADWKAPKALDKCLKRESMPRSVAFGDKFDSYFLVREDGTWECNDVPDDLLEKLEDKKEKPDLVCVTLGPSGEWFLRCKNGRMWWGGISEDLDDMIQQLLESDRYLNFLDFGESETYFLSYD